jgi:O-antigen/teichoic acid export membrane protein
MNFINSTSKKKAITLAYLALILNTLSSIFLTPFLLKRMGADGYGLYQMVYSIANYILILDLGISTVMVRYISEYSALNDRQGEENFAAHMGILTLIITIVVIILGSIMVSSVENIYTNLTEKEYSLSRQMIVMMTAQFGITIIDHYFQGIILAYERFVFIRVFNIIKIALSFTLTIIFVSIGMGAIGVVFANLIIMIAILLVDISYVHSIIKFKICFHKWEYTIIRPAFGLMLAMLLQSIINHVNSSVDKIILGIMTTKIEVAIYSIAATIITMYNLIPTTISGFFQPTVTKMIINDATKSDLTDLVIRVGRWQFMIVGAILCGFVLFGKDFIILWTGNSMIKAWYIALIIMVPNMIPLVQSVCLSILNGYDKRLYRSLILVFITIINIILTILLIKMVGPIGAPIGTGISYFIGHGILLNIYYAKVIKLQIKRMFHEIFRRTWICLILSTLICYPFVFWSSTAVAVFFLKVLAFCILYGALLYIYGWNNQEKKEVVNIAKHLLNRITKMRMRNIYEET